MRMQRSLFFVAIVLIARLFGHGQSNPNTDQGMKPYDSLHGGALDSVSISSGNLFVHSQLYGPTQRGRVGLGFSFQYNNKGFALSVTCLPDQPNNCTRAWQWNGSGVGINIDGSLGVASDQVDTGETDSTGNEIWTTVYSAYTSDGSAHQLADTGNGYRSIDGSGILWNQNTGVVQDRGGIYNGGLLDANGNSIVANGNYTDTLGRVIPFPGSTTNVSNCPQLNLAYQPVTSAYTWNVPGPTGTSSYILCYTSVYIRTAFWGNSYTYTQQLQDVSQSAGMLQSVVQPDGTVWTFQYDAANPNDTNSIAYGDLLKIGLPTGGSISYTYATQAAYLGYYYPGLQTAAGRSVLTRSVDANDGAGAHTWHYTWGNVITATSTNYVVENTVTDPLENDIVHQLTGFFGGPSLYETQTRYYQGSATSGTLLKTVNTDYSYSSNPFDHLGPNLNPPTAINVVPIRVKTVWPNGQTNMVETDYDSGSFSFRDPLWGLPVYPPTSLTSATYSATLGTVKARREYDYGSGAPGGLLQETFTTYLWQGNSNYLTANMLDLPATVTVCSALGTGESADSTGCIDSNFTLKRRSQSVFGYDDPSRLYASNITTQHSTPPGPVRGNLTSVASWLNTSGCNPQTAGSCPTVYTNWYDTGEVYQSIDALGNAITHTYDSAYAGAYSTKTCNALNQCVSGTYDFNSGLLTSFTDSNGTTQSDPAHTSNYTYDAMMRMTSALLPPDSSGAPPETDFSYPSATTVKRTRKQDSTRNVVDYAYSDGLGRTVQTRLVDAEGDDFVDTTYDALGRVSTVSNPHRSASSPTDGVTTTAYDALGRITQTTKQDGSLTAAQYSGTCATTTNEVGSQRRTCADGLGRLVEVDEPQASSVGTSATASVTISGALQSYQSSAPPAALTGSGLAGYSDPSGNQHWAYLGNNGHLYNLYWTPAGIYSFDDVTLLTGAPTAAGTAVTGFPSSTAQFAYFGSNQHVYNFWWNGGSSYGYGDATAASGAPAAGSGSPLASFVDSSGGQHWAYFGSNQHVYNVYWNGNYGYGDATGGSGAPAAASGSSLTAFGDSGGGQHWAYLDTNRHIYNLYWNGNYGYADATAGANAPLASSSTRLASFGDSGGGQHWAYLDSSGNGYNLYWNSGTYANANLTNATNAPAAAGNAIAGFMDSGGSQHWAYFTSSQDVLNFWWNGSSYGYQDATAGSDAPAAAANGALVGFKDPWGGQHWAYFGTNNHVYNVWWNSGSYGYQDVNTATNLVYDAGTASLTVGGITATVCYGNSTNSACTGQPVNNYPSQVASALASAINAANGDASASASGATINLTWKVPGPFTPAISALSTTHDNPGLFPGSSFTSPAANFAGGAGNLGSSPYVTLYSYDSLGNLTQVNQKGDGSQAARIRAFEYDSQSHLLTSNNPESGQISYVYDVDGNMLQKTAPAPNQTGNATQTISYCYDKLKRVTGKAYSAQNCQNGLLPSGTAVVSYFYDSGANGIGRLTSVTDQAGSATYSYDALGRVFTEQRTTAGITKSLSYTYNVDGSVKTLSYPSGAVLGYSYSTAGRVGAVQDTTNSITYVSGSGGISNLASHAPDGSLTNYVNGYNGTFSGIVNKLQYDQRLQLCRITALTGGTLPSSCADAVHLGNVFDLGYTYNLGLSDNGNALSVINYRDNSRTQTFTYDALNRITSAQNAGTDCTRTTLNGKTEYWGNSYAYDAWGNLTGKTVTKCSAENLNISASAINQLHTISGTDYLYDAAGNMTYDATYGVNYSFDPENRISGGAGYTYVYDADGNRVEKTTGGSSPTGTIYWYMSIGIVAESDLSGTLKSEYVFFGGERVARKDFPANAVSYYFSDHLKSASVITNSTGTITSDSDYYPWGGELQFVNSDSNHFKFTGKERDSETGLDYFGARYYGNWYGRFVTPDWSSGPATVPFAHLDSPQTLNLYSYVDNNPINGFDPDGHAFESIVAGAAYSPFIMSSRSGEVTNFSNLVDVKIIRIITDYLTNTVTQITIQSSTMTAQQAKVLSSAEVLNIERQQIAKSANRKESSFDYLVSKANGNYKAGSDKCNELVADTIEEAGLPRPQVHYTNTGGFFGWVKSWFKRDPDANEWANPNVTISGWSAPKPLSEASAGDVIAQAHGSWGHSGIVVEPGQTVSVNTANQWMQGIVTKNNWGFRPRPENGEGPRDPAPVVRHYMGQ